MTSRRQFSKTLAAAMIAQGFREATPEIVRDILDSWCAGVRGVLLPQGLMGAWVGHHLSELDREMPGKIAKLTKRTAAVKTRLGNKNPARFPGGAQ